MKIVPIGPNYCLSIESPHAAYADFFRSNMPEVLNAFLTNQLFVWDCSNDTSEDTIQKTLIFEPGRPKLYILSPGVESWFIEKYFPKKTVVQRKPVLYSLTVPQPQLLRNYRLTQEGVEIFDEQLDHNLHMIDYTDCNNPKPLYYFQDTELLYGELSTFLCIHFDRDVLDDIQLQQYVNPIFTLTEQEVQYLFEHGIDYLEEDAHRAQAEWEDRADNYFTHPDLT